MLDTERRPQVLDVQSTPKQKKMKGKQTLYDVNNSTSMFSMVNQHNSCGTCVEVEHQCFVLSSLEIKLWGKLKQVHLTAKLAALVLLYILLFIGEKQRSWTGAPSADRLSSIKTRLWDELACNTRALTVVFFFTASQGLKLQTAPCDSGSPDSCKEAFFLFVWKTFYLLYRLS